MTINNLTNTQLPLFVYGEPSENIKELLPVIWNATESLASSDPVTRQHGIDTLLEFGAQRASALVAYTIATCLGDPEIYIRRRVVYILADLIAILPGVKPAPEHVRKAVTHYLHRMNTEIVFGLLEVSVIDTQTESAIYHLLNACPTAGHCLGDILADWKNSLPMRQAAIHFIGLVGYMEELPVLERMLDKLQSRHSGQYAMSFASSANRNDGDLIPHLRIAIEQMSSH